MLSRYAHGKDGDIVPKESYHPDNERAGLVAIMKVQDRWLDPLAWREEREKEVDGWHEKGQALPPGKKRINIVKIAGCVVGCRFGGCR